MRLILELTCVFAFICVAVSHVHYVPAQVLIPVYNGTHNGTNHTVNQPIRNSTKWNTPRIYGLAGALPIYAAAPPNNYGWAPPVPYNPGGPSNNQGYNNNNVQNNSSYNGTEDGHLFLGQVSTYDRLLFNKEYFKDSRWWTYRESIIEYPKDLPQGYNRHDTITAIKIYNKFYHGNTARATIMSGGIGRQYVKIRLASTWGNGFRYLVQIFGH